LAGMAGPPGCAAQITGKTALNANAIARFRELLEFRCMIISSPRACLA
jgi:hypothetical protein